MQPLRAARGFFTSMNCPPASISVESASSADARKPSRSVCPSYFGWSLTNTPIIPELLRASRMPAMLGMYRRFSSSAVTRCTVSSETLFVFP